MQRRKFELITDKDEIIFYQKILDNCLDCVLDSFKKFCLNPQELKIDYYYTSHEKILMQYEKLSGDFSLYYSKFYESDENDYYLFGSTKNRKFNSSSYLKSNEYITPKLIANINCHEVNKSALLFARDCKTNDVVLLLRIDWSNLLDREKDRLLDKNENRILNTEEDKQFINFGSISNINIKSLLKNIRGFVSNVELIFDDSEEFINNPHIKIRSVNVPLDYKCKFKEELSSDMMRTIADVVIFKEKTPKIEENSEFIQKDINQTEDSTKKIKYCMLCGREIEESYENESALKELVGENPTKCKSCVEEIMMSYFKSKFNTKVFNIYLNLLKTNDLINHEVNFDFNDQFNKDVKDYSYFYDEIPEDLKIEIKYCENSKDLKMEI